MPYGALTKAAQVKTTASPWPPSVSLAMRAETRMYPAQQQAARAARTMPPGGREAVPPPLSSATPPAATQAGTRSARRREAARAMVKGPRNSIVATTPSGTLVSTAAKNAM